MRIWISLTSADSSRRVLQIGGRNADVELLISLMLLLAPPAFVASRH